MKKGVWIRWGIALLLIVLLASPVWIKWLRPGLDPLAEPVLREETKDWISLGVPERWTVTEEITAGDGDTLELKPEGLSLNAGISIQRMGPEEYGRFVREETAREIGAVLMNCRENESTVWVTGFSGMGRAETRCAHRYYTGSRGGSIYEIHIYDMQDGHPLLKSATLEAILRSIEFREE